MRADLSPQRTQRPTEAPPWTSVLSVVSFLLLLPALAGAIGPAVVEDRLPNGAALLVSEQRNLPMVLVRVVLDAGARRDPQGKAGLANLTADLLTEGTSTRSAQQIKDAIDFIGGALQTSADTDYAVASLQVLRKDLDTGLALLALLAILAIPEASAAPKGTTFGCTLAQVQAAKPTMDYDPLYGRRPGVTARFVEVVYGSLTQGKAE